MEEASEVGSTAPSEAPTAELRPRLRQDVIFAESDDGVYLQRPGDQFVLRGRSMYRWISLLAPRMTGEYSVEELASGLSDEHQRTLFNLLGILTDRGYLHDGSATPQGLVPPGVRAAFERQIGYIAHFSPPGETGFMAFRSTRVLLIGTPELVAATGIALLRNGAAEITVSGVVPEALAEEVARIPPDDCPCTVRELGTGELDAAQLAEFELVIGAGEDIARLLRINAAASSGDGPALLPSLILGDRAIVGPLVRAGGKPCWQCALLRQSGARPAEDGAALWRAAALGGRCDAESCPPHLARMLGTLLAFEVFRARTGALAAETEGAVITQDLKTVESDRQRLLPHPLCSHCGGGAAAPANGASAVAEAEVFGMDGGVIGGHRDLSLSQSPLRVGRVLLHSASGSGSAAREITAFDLDTVEHARSRAIQAAAVCYADEVAGRGTMIAPSGGVEGEIVPVTDLATQTGLVSHVGGRWVPAWSVTGDRVYRIPAAAAYPGSQHNQLRAVERTSSGAACAVSTEEAVRAGLLSALGFVGLRAALRGDRPAQEIILPGADGDLEFLLRTAKSFAGSVRFLDLPGADPSFACVVTVDDGSNEPLWTLGVGYDRDSAFVAGLRDLIGVMSMRAHGECVDLGDPVLPGIDPRAIPVETDTRPVRAPVTHHAIVDVLRAREGGAVAVDTTPSDLREAGLVTVRVLLHGSEYRC